jgi:hypothetical protein
LWNDKLTLNLPEKKFSFNRNIINNYCVDNLIPPVYEPIWDNRTGKVRANIENVDFDASMSERFKPMDLPAHTTVQEDMDLFVPMLKYSKKGIGDIGYNTDKYSEFLKGFAKKYSIEKARYYAKYVFLRYFCYN